MKQRAILIFADSLGADLARRRLPRALRPLFALPAKTDSGVGADVHVFSSAQGSGAAKDGLHLQCGRSFAEKLENAVEQVATLGYREIVIVGRDCPRLNQDDIAAAFDALGTRRLVLGPDHRGGCYLIAFKAPDRQLLSEIRWKRNTDFAELRARCQSGAVHTLAVKHDLDSWSDVKSLARAGDVIARLAAFFLRALPETRPSLALIFDSAAQRLRVRGQMPPPAFAA